MFVANFVGEREILFLDGAVEAGRTGHHFILPGAAFPLKASTLNFDVINGRHVKLGVRAEAVELVESADPAAVPVTVSQVELSGPDLIVYATTSSGLELCCRAPSHRSVASGDLAHMALVSSRLHVFDPATEAAIELPGRRTFEQAVGKTA
jgi:ABC-type sugar transport system ATPase subunit